MGPKASRRLLVGVLWLLVLLVAGCLGDPTRAGAACPLEPTAEAGPEGDVDLSWEPVSDAESYPILRSEPDTDPTLIANVSGSTTSYTDASAEPGRSYTYIVHSWNGTARSTDCPVTEVTTVPFFPNLAATIAIGGLAALGAFSLHRRG